LIILAELFKGFQISLYLRFLENAPRLYSRLKLYARHIVKQLNNYCNRRPPWKLHTATDGQRLTDGDQRFSSLELVYRVTESLDSKWGGLQSGQKFGKSRTSE